MPGQLIGCAYGLLDVLGQLFGSALLSLGAYAAETVGLLWAALMLFQLRWRRGTVFRCDSTSALHAMHGQVDGKPHSVCRAARSLHLALMCLLGSGIQGIVPMSWRTLWLPEVLKALVVVAFSDWTFPAGSAVTALFLIGFTPHVGSGSSWRWATSGQWDSVLESSASSSAEQPCQGVRPIFEGIANQAVTCSRAAGHDS